MKPTLSLLAILTLVLLTATTCLAANVTLSWDPSPSSDVAGYKIYYKVGSASSFNGTGLPEGDSPIDAGNNLSQALSGLQTGVVYTFTVTAYDQSNVESLYADSITWTSNDPAPFIPALTFPADRAQDLPTSVIFSWTAPPDDRNVTYTLVFGTDPSLSNPQVALALPAGKASGHPIGATPLYAASGLFALVLGLRKKRLPLAVLLLGATLVLCNCGGDTSTGLSGVNLPTGSNPVTTPSTPETPPSTTPVAQNFTSEVPNIADTSFEIYDFTPGTTYYWKVRADDGSTVTESPTQSFVTAVQ